MKKITKALLIALALVLTLAAFTACDAPNTQPDPQSCTHQGGKATCTEAAVCELCGESYGTALGHTEEIIEGKDATCEEKGLTQGKKCSVCGTTLVAQEEIPALNHEYVINYVWNDNLTCTATATCQNDASHTYSETAAVSTVTLNVSATTVTYTYNAFFENENFEEQTATDTGAVQLVNSIATINAPVVENRVASHDYVKFGLHNVDKTYTFTIHYSELDVWDGTSASASLAGDGTMESPFLIQSGADLAYIAKVVNEAAAKTANFADQHFKMTKSIDLNGNPLYIGSYASSLEFHGYFEGNNCTIRGLNSEKSLFGYVKAGFIRNLSVYGSITSTTGRTGGVASYVNGAIMKNLTNYVAIDAVNAVGGIVGWMENNIDTYVTDCVNYANVTGSSYQIGGIAGNAKGNVSKCTNFGDVTSTKSGYVGGIGGTTKDANGTMSNCNNYGNVSATDSLAGVCGFTNKTVMNCNNYGNVIKTNCTTTEVGGVASGTPTLSGCNDYGTVIISHSMTHHGANGASCTADGNVEYWACSVCKKNYADDKGENVIADVVIPMVDHNWDNGVIEGQKVTYTCEKCGATKILEGLSDLKYVWSADNSSCTASAKQLVDGATISETATVTVVTLNVTATKVVYTYKVEFKNSNFEPQTKQVEAAVEPTNSIATIIAPTMPGRVASHEYVKFGLRNEGVSHTFNIYYSEIVVWDGTSVSTSLAGSGTAEDPFLIQSGADLAYIAKVVNEAAANTANFNGMYFKMTKSIDLNSNPLSIGGSFYNNKFFYGNLDGNNCVIKNINSSEPLFGRLYDGYVMNLSLYGSITAGTEDAKANKYVAALAGNIAGAGKIENVTSYVSVQGCAAVSGIVASMGESSQVINCANYGNVTASSYQISGITGAGKGALIKNCVNFGNVTSTGSGYVGGISGTSKDANVVIEGCTNYGDIKGTTHVGGIVGTKGKGALTDNANYGKVEGSGANVGEIYGS